jgi:hypothetical protein
MIGRRQSTIRVAAALAVLVAAHPAPGQQPAERRDTETAAYRVIVHPRNPHRVLSRSFLRDAFLRKSVTWPDGETIRPADLSRPYAARARFELEIVGKTPAQLRAYWNQQVFSGKGVPPPALDSEAAVLAYVRRHRGSVAYVPATASTEGVAVVAIK